jgi:hypothetical protein
MWGLFAGLNMAIPFELELLGMRKMQITRQNPPSRSTTKSIE